MCGKKESCPCRLKALDAWQILHCSNYIWYWSGGHIKFALIACRSGHRITSLTSPSFRRHQTILKTLRPPIQIPIVAYFISHYSIISTDWSTLSRLVLVTLKSYHDSSATSFTSILIISFTIVTSFITYYHTISTYWCAIWRLRSCAIPKLFNFTYRRTSIASN